MGFPTGKVLLIGWVVPEIEIVKHVEQVHFAAKVKFIVNVVQIRIDGSHSDPHVGGNFVVSLALANQIGKFLLARGKFFPFIEKAKDVNIS